MAGFAFEIGTPSVAVSVFWPDSQQRTLYDTGLAGWWNFGSRFPVLAEAYRRELGGETVHCVQCWRSDTVANLERSCLQIVTQNTISLFISWLFRV